MGYRKPSLAGISSVQPKLILFSTYSSHFAFLIDNELTTKWLNRLRDTAHNNESREMQGQLSSILDFYNKQSTGTETLDKIDWKSYEKAIHTPDIVAKIQAKYDEFMEAEY